MKVVTNFFGDERFTFDRLMYIDYGSKEVVFSADLSDRYSTFMFFRSLAKFVKTARVLETVYHQNNNHFQFAVMYQGKLAPIVWFDFLVGEDCFSHDSAFSTTLIRKNGQILPFGGFPMHAKKQLPKYREFNLKSRVFKYLANRVMRQGMVATR